MSTRNKEDIRDIFKGSLEICVQPQPSRDEIIVSYMVKDRPSFLDQKASDFVIQRLTETAKGSAIWIHTAVDLLAARKIRAPAKLRAFPRDELPQSKLSDLYAKLFPQVAEDDEENTKVLTDALEILAIAERPLSISELGWAVALRDTEADIATIENLEEYVDTKRVLGLVSPFIASVDFDEVKSHQVRLVHQSVRELVFQATPCQWSSLRASAPISKEAARQRVSKLNGVSVQAVRQVTSHERPRRQKPLFGETNLGTGNGSSGRTGPF